MTRQIINFLQSKNKKYLLIAPTGVAAQNIGGKTIHSSLKIRYWDGRYETLIFSNLAECKEELRKIDAIVIDEISMVDSELFTFISNIFSRLHSNDYVFGNVPTLVVGDLAQLPPIRPSYVFNSPAWKRFFPLFLTTPQRQMNDAQFYQILQEVRTGNLSCRSKEMIQSKIDEDRNVDKLHDTTHVVGTRQEAENINVLLCDHLPFDETCSDPIVSKSVDTLDFEMLTEDNLCVQFKNLTNLPESVYLQVGARVMFLNNKLFDESICNGTIGVVTRMIDDENVEVTFPTLTSISKIIVQKETYHFEADGKNASRRQFPLQNAFALTVHKTQGLTLPHVTLSVDENMFAEGQAYVAMSRATSLEKLRIVSFDCSRLKVPRKSIKG